MAPPEIVVSKLWTEVTDGSAPSSAPTYYAYGWPNFTYDSLAGHWVFGGYRRQVTVSGVPGGGPDGSLNGVITIADRSASAMPGATYGEHAVANQVVQVQQIERYGVSPTSVADWVLATFINPFAKGADPGLHDHAARRAASCDRVGVGVAAS